MGAGAALRGFQFFGLGAPLCPVCMGGGGILRMVQLKRPATRVCGRSCVVVYKGVRAATPTVLLGLG